MLAALVFGQVIALAAVASLPEASPRSKEASCDERYELLYRLGPTRRPPHKLSIGPIASVAFSADGKRIASAAGQTVRIRDARTGRLLRAFAGQGARVLRAVFTGTAGGRKIVSLAGDRTVRVWETDKAKPTATLTIDGMGYSLAVSPDGKTLAIGCFGENVKRIGPWAGFARVLGVPGCDAVTFSSDGSRIVSCMGRRVFIWDAGTGARVSILHHPKRVYRAAFIPGAKRLITSCLPGPGSPSRALDIWDVASKQRVEAFRGHEQAVWGFTVSSDGTRVISADASGRVTVWDTRSRRCLQTIPTMAGEIFPLALSPDGKLLAVGGYRFIFTTKKGVLDVYGRPARQPGSRSQPARQTSETRGDAPVTGGE